MTVDHKIDLLPFFELFFHLDALEALDADRLHVVFGPTLVANILEMELDLKVVVKIVVFGNGIRVNTPFI